MTTTGTIIMETVDMTAVKGESTCTLIGRSPQFSADHIDYQNATAWCDVFGYRYVIEQGAAPDNGYEYMVLSA